MIRRVRCPVGGVVLHLAAAIAGFTMSTPVVAAAEPSPQSRSAEVSVGPGTETDPARSLTIDVTGGSASVDHLIFDNEPAAEGTFTVSIERQYAVVEIEVNVPRGWELEDAGCFDFTDQTVLRDRLVRPRLFVLKVTAGHAYDCEYGSRPASPTGPTAAPSDANSPALGADDPAFPDVDLAPSTVQPGTVVHARNLTAVCGEYVEGFDFVRLSRQQGVYTADGVSFPPGSEVEHTPVVIDYSGADGTFVVPDVPPGSYVIYLICAELTKPQLMDAPRLTVVRSGTTPPTDTADLGALDPGEPVALPLAVLLSSLVTSLALRHLYRLERR